MGKGLKNKN